MVREIASALAGKAAVVQVNTQENGQVAGRFGITGIPALILLRRGRVVDNLSGAQSKDAVLSWFRKSLAR